MNRYILSLDQGTTSSRAVLYDENGTPAGMAQKEFEQIFPQPGWVEHDAEEIWQTQLAVAQEVIAENNINPGQLYCIGITNQRETTVLWDKNSGKPIHNAIVWQDRRTASFCKELIDGGHLQKVSKKTGLVIDAYFSATKIRWLLDNVEGARQRAESGDLLFGTIDSWLIYNLSGGKSHVTDVSNASRTMLYNIHELAWDEELLELLDVPAAILPKVVDSSGEAARADAKFFDSEIPISGIAGDQQAALFGQMCILEGMAKCTYGTGCFLVLNTGSTPVESGNNLLTTIGWKIGDEITYAMEGSVFIAGAAIQWLRDGLNFFESAADSEDLAKTVSDNGDVYFVPALSGLGAPYWDQDARGTIVGLTRGSTKAHITRAALESIAFQVNDVLEIMNDDRGERTTELRVDGGAVANDLLIQFQSDISQIDVIRPRNPETTALGAAYLAGLGVGLWSMEELKSKWSMDQVFSPQMKNSESEKLRVRWAQAVKRARNWAKS